MSVLPHYTQESLDSNIEIASIALSCKAATLANQWRMGSIDIHDQKKLELCLAQLECIKTFSILELPATGTLIVTGDGGTNVNTVIKVNGVTISKTFRYTTSNTVTAGLIADAINALANGYSAISTGSNVIITANTAGSTPNGYHITQTGGDITMSGEYLHDGQDGVESNNITEEQLTFMFNNIASFANCCYKTTFNAASSLIQANHVILVLNSGTALQLNTLAFVELNTLQLIS